MIKWLNAPINVTPGTQGAWTDVDNAAVPSGAKGVFLCYENNVTANPPGDKDVGARKNGSTDTFLSKGYWNNSPTGIGTHHYVQVAVDADGIFEVYVQDTSLTTVWLLGYWENDANVVMLTNVIDKTPTRDDTWRTVDIASDTGADTAVAAIITHYQPDGNYESSGVRKIGSTNTAMYGGWWHNTTIVTLNGSEQFEARVAAGGASKIYLIGYLKGGWVDAESVGPWTDPTVSQAWRSPTLADKPSGATDEYIAAIALCWYGVTANARGLRHRRWSSWDVRRKLSKDGLQWMVIPFDAARKYDDWMYDQPNQYGFIYGYVKKSVSAPSGGTALVHLHKEDYTERTTTSASEVEVTQYTIAWSDLTAAGFAAGDTVMMIGKACVGGASTTALQANFRASRGTSFAGRTTWTDSASLHEPASTTAGMGHSWQWIKSHTLVANENIYFSLATSSTTARVDDFVFWVIKLGDSGGLATDDYRYAETTPSGNASTTYTDGASVTLPGAKASSWAILASCHWLIDSTSADVRQKIVVGSDSLCEARYEGENTSEETTYGNFAIAHYIGSDTTAKVQYNVDSTSTHDCVRTAIFALRLDAFESWTLDSTLLTKTLSALDTYITLFDTGFLQRDSTARDVMYMATARTGATGDASKKLYGRVREDANEWPATGSDRASYQHNGSSDQLAPWWMGKKTSVAQGNYNLNFQVAEDSDVSPTYTVPEAYFFAFVPRLASTSGGTTALAGGAADVAAATGALSTGIPLAGASLVVATTTGALSTGIPLAGAMQATSASTGGVTTQIKAAGAAQDVATAGGALSTGIPLAGAMLDISAATGALTATIQLSGAALAQALASAGLSSAIRALGAAQDVATAAAALTTAIPLTGGAAAQAGGSGTLSAPAAQLAGQALASAVASGNLSTVIRLIGAASGQVLASAALATGINLAGAASSQASGSATLTGVAAQLAGSAIAQALASGDLTTLVRLVGAPAATALATGSLTTQISLSAAAVASALAAAGLTTGIRLTGTAQDVASATGSLQGGALMTGAAQDVATAAAALTTAIPLSAQVLASAIATGGLTAQIRLSGAALAQALAAAGLTTGNALAGVAQDVASASGALTAQIRFGGALFGEAAAAGDLATQIRLGGAALAEVLAVAGITADIRLSGAATAAAAASAVMAVGVSFAGLAANDASASGTLQTSIALSGQTVSAAIASATLVGTVAAAPRRIVTGRTRDYTARGRARDYIVRAA